MTIEQVRGNDENPPLPTWLSDDYAKAWRELFSFALAILPSANDENLVNSALAVLALQKGQPMLARMAILTESERSEMLNEVGWG
ncbi:hypothetical protein [Caulobacter sp. DWR1-3-2b1]|uniref:hypothetical protein n=1 Tax=Caulobacter sp. DWR1-3-2b1 TaxID=2804670 RepID=UPI003CEF1110